MNGSSTMMKVWLSAGLLAVSSMSAMAAQNPDDVIGYWRTIDDQTGFSKAIVRIQKAVDGTYLGTIVKIIPRPDYTPKVYCYRCPQPFTGKKILGLPLLWNAKYNDNGRSTISYGDAYVIDPLSGKIYNGKMKLSPDNRRLIMRGYVGVSALGRTQIWVREDASIMNRDDINNLNTTPANSGASVTIPAP
jgi:uncharacterized protein (DUF2147 family)